MRGAALEMGWQMVKNNMDENVALSPVSISGALHMLAAGSGGNTRAELLKLLGISKPEECSKGQKHLVTQYADFINNLDDSGEAFPIFNGLYVNEPVGKLNSPRDANPLYLNIFQKNYVKKLGEVKDLDFKEHPEEAQDYINSAVERATNGMIPDLVTGLDSSTLSVIVSAIYYENEWDSDQGLKFKQLSTKLTEDFSRYCFAKDKRAPCQSGVQWIQTESERFNGIKHREVTTDGIQMDVFSLPQKSKRSNVKFNLNIFKPVNDDLSVLADKNSMFFVDAFNDALQGYNPNEHSISKKCLALTKFKRLVYLCLSSALNGKKT